MEGKVLEREYEIHYYEIDYKKRLLITRLMDYFGDMALKQAEYLGIGMDYLLANNMVWVLYKWDINIITYPMYEEKIKIKTYPVSIRKFYAYRMFEVRDESGNIIGTAKSIWLLIDYIKRRPIKVNENIYSTYGLKPEIEEPFQIDEIKEVERVDNSTQFKVRYTDIDTNKHVNNAKYADWVIETVPLEIASIYSLKNLNLQYHKETNYGEEVKVLTQISYDKDTVYCIHNIQNKEGKKITSGTSLWVNH
jgi:medium-chain acyl-[acyl-carrier-protein] hydrolase